MTGRKRQYATAAERQAAYRQRRAEQNVTDTALRNCPNCGADRLKEMTGLGFQFLHMAEQHGGRAWLCFNCFQCTSQIGESIITGELVIELTGRSAPTH